MIAGAPPLEKSDCPGPLWISHPHHFLLSLLPSEVDEDRIPNPLLKVSWPLPLSPVQRTPRLIRGLCLQPLPPTRRTFCLPAACALHMFFLSGGAHSVPCIPPTVFLLTIMGRVGAGEARVSFPPLSEAHTSPVSIYKHGKAEGRVKRVGAHLCPAPFTAHFVHVSTATEEGNEDHTHNERFGKPFPATPDAEQ